MKKLLVTALLYLALLSGCNKQEPYVVNSFEPLEIPVTSGSTFTMEVPVDSPLVRTDNNVFWDYDNGVSIILLSDNSHGTAKSTEYKDVYVTSDTAMRTFDFGTVLVECEPNMVDIYSKLLSEGNLSETSMGLEATYCMDKLPEYEEQEMELDSQNFYMPVGSVKNVSVDYQSAIATSGTDWIESWIKDASIDELSTMFVTLATANTVDEDAQVDWYKDDNILYVEYGNNIVAGKRLSYNQWYIYSSSNVFKDYVLQGLDLIRRGN